MFNGIVTKENNDNVTKMLYEAVHEMALSRGDSIEYPVSLSLFLLNMGVDDPSVEDKLIKKSNGINNKRFSKRIQKNFVIN